MITTVMFNMSIFLWKVSCFWGLRSVGCTLLMLLHIFLNYTFTLFLLMFNG